MGGWEDESRLSRSEDVMAFIDELLLLLSVGSICKAVCSSARLENGKHSGSLAFRVLPPDELQQAAACKAATRLPYLIAKERQGSAPLSNCKGTTRLCTPTRGYRRKNHILDVVSYLLASLKKSLWGPLSLLSLGQGCSSVKALLS